MFRALSVFAFAAAAALVLQLVAADVYMHNPRGSNNRFNEANVNRNNANRLFDSQNNNNGGYNIGERNADANPLVIGQLSYYGGSELLVEWTAQHGCGVDQDKTHCELILQYACDSGSKEYNAQDWDMSDGTTTGNNANPPATGVNEPIPSYTKCTRRERNKGLYTADQNLRGDTAKYTRQDANGNQYGTECPEERDYYPYWHPTVWKDIAIFTSNPERCAYYQAESQNVKAKYECECADWYEKVFEDRTGCPQNTECWDYNNEGDCTANTECEWVAKGHSNVTFPRSADEGNLPPPECLEAPWSRDNHLGNGLDAQMLNYTWTVPSPIQACGSSHCDTCVLRLRYNITTDDHGDLQQWQLPEGVNVSDYQSYWDIDARLNGDDTIKMDNVSNYYENDPVANFSTNNYGLAIALDTDQSARTFQDRSHSFEIMSWPDNVPASARLVNINVRGKRGNIVQVYPAIEYDFVPNTVEVNTGDFVHFQWTGSNTNPNNFDGQGRAGTDRNNVVQIDSMDANYPSALEDMNMLQNDEETIIDFATSNHGVGVDDELDDAPPYFNSQPMQMSTAGEYYYMCTRNNNFSNRSQKAKIVVTDA